MSDTAAPCTLADRTSPSALARSAGFNILGQILPLLIAVPALPYTIRGLGTERFGILSIALVVLVYFSVFDFGLGRATTKYVAEALGREDTDAVPRIIWTSLGFILICGCLAAGALFLATPVVVAYMHVAVSLRAETLSVFHVLCISLLVALLSASLNGVLEAYQRFDIINIVRVPGSALTYAVPVVVIACGGGLRAVVVALLAKNIGVTLIQAAICSCLVPRLAASLSLDLALAPAMLRFGLWVFVTNAAVTLLMYLDRFMVAGMLSMSAVTYYAGPYELINRATIIPSSIVMVLFPAVSSLRASDTALQHLVDRAARHLIIIMGSITAVIVAFAPAILCLWLGRDFLQSSLVLRTLAVGVFFSSLAWLAGTVLQATDGQRSVMVIHLVQLPMYVLMTWMLVKAAGANGAALAWSLRMLMSAALLLLVCRRSKLVSLRSVVPSNMAKFVVIASGLSAVTAVGVSLRPPQSWAILVAEAALFVSALGCFVWRCVLYSDELMIVRNTIQAHLPFRRS